MTDLLERQEERTYLPPTWQDVTPPKPGRTAWVMITIVAVLFGVAAGVALFRGDDQSRVQEIQELRAEATVEWYEARYAEAMRHEAALAALGAQRVEWYEAQYAKAMLQEAGLAALGAERVATHEAQYAETLRQAAARDTLAEQRVDWYEARYDEAWAARVAAGG